MDWAQITAWAMALVGVLGVGGAIAACILAPAVALPIVESVVSAILRCKVCLWTLFALALCVGSFWFGHHTAVLKCRENEVAAELRNREVDLEAASQARSDETKRANEIEARSNAQRQSDAAYIEELKARPACLLDDTDIDDGVHPATRSRRAKTPAGPQ